MISAAPAWFADNMTQISAGTLVVLMFLVIRLVQKLAIRIALLILIAAVGLFAYINRAPLEQCAKTCECEIAGQELSVPICDADLKL